MLSIVDLLDAGTVTRELAVYLLAAIRGGASFMVGARPGGAGKTTVMGALLNFVPTDVELRPADGSAAIARGMKDAAGRSCFICHEIGAGHFYAYLWGQPLRDYFGLLDHGHLLATNLHADTLEEARAQICDQNHVPATRFRRMNMALFLHVSGGWRGKREIVEVWESDGKDPHRRIYAKGNLDSAACRLIDGDQLEEANARLDRVIAAKARTIEQVRGVLCGDRL